MTEPLQLYVVAYDISNDRLRTRVYQRLLDFGARLQGSVFECHLNEKHFGLLCRELERLIDDYWAGQAAAAAAQQLELPEAECCETNAGNDDAKSQPPDIATVVIYRLGSDWEERRTCIGEAVADTVPPELFVV